MRKRTNKASSPSAPTMNGIQDRVVELRRIRAGELSSHPMNFRRHPKEQLDALSGILGEVGIADAVLGFPADGRGSDGDFSKIMIFDGHARKDRDPNQVWPVLITNLTRTEADKMLAVLDPISAMAQNEETILKGLVESCQFENESLQKMLDELTSGSSVESTDIRIDEVPEAAESITKTGDVWELGPHRLICGDSTDELSVIGAMAGEMADCVFTSPPYAVGIDYGVYEDTIQNLRNSISVHAGLFLKIVRPGGFAVLNFGDIASGRELAGCDEPCEYPMGLEYWPVFRQRKWSLWSRRIWCKPNPRVHSLQCIGSNRAATDWEHIWTWKAPGSAIVDRVDGQMRSCLGWIDTSNQHGVDVGKDEHGAGMALSIAAHMIAIHSIKGGIVFEPFTGTGTTLIAAQQLGRRCIGFEINPAYCDLIVKRWENFTGLSGVRKPSQKGA